MDQPGPSKKSDEGTVHPPNAAAGSLPDDQSFEEKPNKNTIDVQIPDEKFQVYLEQCGVLQAINHSLTALYHTEPKPVSATSFLCNQLLHYNDTSIHPLMQLVAMRRRIQQLEEQYQLLREKWYARIRGNEKKC